MIYVDLCTIIYQAGFNKTRENGIKYASAGLVWKGFGKQLIEQFLVQYFKEAYCDIDYIFESFDSLYISIVDCEDNGISTVGHCFSFISSFLPLWFNSNTDSFNSQFNKALLTTIAILEEELKTTIGKAIAKNDKNVYHCNKFSSLVPKRRNLN